MKKKGLIISSIVMVVVLIASLTTATYAWFNASSVTKIDAFNVSVKTNNAIKIGVKTDNAYDAQAGEDDFKTGEVTYTAGTAGVLGGGSWGGDISGLSATIEHNIKWGEQSKAVGFSTTAVGVTSSDDNTILSSLTTAINAASGNGHTQGEGYVYAANGVNGDAQDVNGSLNGIAAAVANNDTHDVSDYVYLFLGAAPTRTLLTNELIILLDGNNGTGVTLGLLAAVHVAYRLNSDGAWTDARIFSGNDNQQTPAAITNKTLKTNVTSNLSAAENATYVATYGGNAPTTGARALIISGLATAANTIDQIEILIYIDGTDSNCNQNAIAGVGGAISIFFHTTESNS